MQTVPQQDYKVLMTRSPVAKANGGQRWRATLLGFPTIVEEAFSRDQAIKQIEARLADMLAHAEIITLHGPALPMEMNGNSDELAALGWDDYGLFKDDPDALQLFDEVERERNNHLVGAAPEYIASSYCGGRATAWPFGSCAESRTDTNYPYPRTVQANASVVEQI